MIEAYQPDVWIHGQVHNSDDYFFGSARIVCNPRGYQSGTMSSEDRHFIPDLVIELPIRAIG